MYLHLSSMLPRGSFNSSLNIRCIIVMVAVVVGMHSVPLQAPESWTMARAIPCIILFFPFMCMCSVRKLYMGLEPELLGLNLPEPSACICRFGLVTHVTARTSRCSRYFAIGRPYMLYTYLRGAESSIYIGVHRELEFTM